MLNYIKSGLIIFIALWTSMSAQAAGGIALGATRVIYPADAKQTSLAISNSASKERYLVNSWIENSAGVKEKSFVVTPPLFVSEPKSENTLRIIYAGQPLPADRESLFWMNVKAIPSVDKNSLEGKNVLQLAILSRIKLFVRPANLPQVQEDAPGMLQFSRSGNHLKITNPSAYYLTLVNLKVGSQKVDNVMVAPKNNTRILLPAGAQGSVTFQTVNDYGALTPAKTVSLR
ncbi:MULTISPECIES: type 1 fimbria chaperone FimC [Citrobacter]|uniref:type 1 fimbria chaperone FimC n=1 Tax=Citrobacter TaxID=544 RepID=UPI0008DE4EEB|nr:MULTISPECIES: type 1 fimbria chaperone FimC [Citrobacter]MBE0025137.1 type 1 fimbria chaperone FimC [Citrobacter koseri]MBE0081198.1 type 1 fimbria chaperone FimC [Citrobacter koseri]MBJ8812105.1 type 1 fimbria chaperone FimC [Citrobacter koseri]MBJ9139855.1 type 1 fimbria chaperone FimC [Citrobacter koseri]MBJ9344757.1 type 1 fimbria chaperone FimC [Citrobacter koseri]